MKLVQIFKKTKSSPVLSLARLRIHFSRDLGSIVCSSSSLLHQHLGSISCPGTQFFLVWCVSFILGASFASVLPCPWIILSNQNDPTMPSFNHCPHQSENTIRHPHAAHRNCYRFTLVRPVQIAELIVADPLPSKIKIRAISHYKPNDNISSLTLSLAS